MHVTGSFNIPRDKRVGVYFSNILVFIPISITAKLKSTSVCCLSLLLDTVMQV